MEEIKAAYRHRAFELHPDLHPNDPQAVEQFQLLNEAYVLLKVALAQEPPTRTKKRPRPQPGAPKTDQSSGAKSYAKQAQAGSSSQKKRSEASAGKSSGPQQRFVFRKEEVLKNILSDPFAKKVFEDIYRQVRTRGGSGPPPQPITRRRLSLSWGEKQFNLDVSHGILGGLRLWLRKQMDDEQTLHLAPSQLLPGNIVRLTIRRAWSGAPKTIEIPIPPDYVIGRALRLRGLGRKLGPFKGDLYLRLLAG